MLVMKQQLSEGFNMKDMGELHYLLDVNVQLKDGKVILDQHQYFTKLLKRFGLEDIKAVSTPLDPGVKLVKEDGYSTLVNHSLAVYCMQPWQLDQTLLMQWEYLAG